MRRVTALQQIGFGRSHKLARQGKRKESDMAQKSNGTPLSHLQNLADEIVEAYQDAGERVSAATSPVEEAVRKIGVPYQCDHYAENAQALIEQDISLEEATAHRHCFAEEEENEGEVEYALCVARDSKRKCGLHVSICKHSRKDERVSSGPNKGRTRPVITVLEKRLVRPEEVALPIRVKILDVLDDFIESYVEFVRDSRSSILSK